MCDCKANVLHVGRFTPSLLNACGQPPSQTTGGCSDCGPVSPSEIVSKARKAFQASLKLGDEAVGRKALEQSLKVLSTRGPYEDSPSWLSGKIQILGDLGRYAEGQEVLARLANSTRSRASTVPSLDAEDSDADSIFERDIRDAKLLLEQAVHVQSWDQAVQVGSKLGLDSVDLTILSLEDGIAKCKDIFSYGLAEENLSLREVDLEARHGRMKRALQLYDNGCQLIGLCHVKFDPPQFPVTGFDHRVCANLFTSAARVCLGFAESPISLSPAEVGCNPLLREMDWKHQALEFVERGRSRALLNAILENKMVVPREPRELMEKVLQAFKHALQRREDSRTPDRQPRPTLTSSPLQSLTPDRQLRPTLTSSSLQSLTPDSHSEGEEKPRRMSPRAQGNWQKAIRNVIDSFKKKLEQYPVIESALLDEPASLGQMRANIPQDTVIVEFAQASEPPQGLMVLVMTTGGIEAASWREFSIIDINRLIANAGLSMWPEKEKTDANNVSDERGLEALDRLSDILIRPFEKFFCDKRRIVFITSGNLAHVPWAMLPCENPLVGSHSITVAPSFSIWSRLQSRHDILGQHRRGQNVTVVSNSPREYDGRIRNDRIPYSRVEALHIARLHDRWPILADQVSLDTFQKLSKESYIFHLSAHGTFEPEMPWLSKIDVFKDSLRVIDLSRFDLQAALVVFSSCLSGLSRGFDSGSAFGFAHTLLGSGAQAFIGTLWPVDDVTTLLFMMLFYRDLRKGESPAASLRAAQDTMRCVTENQLQHLITELDYLLEMGKDKFEQYVFMFAWRLTEDLPNLDVETFRQPRSWAGFVLTGYGDKPIYDQRRKRKRTSDSELSQW
jgi:CHAT domain-containing protein